jgi:hypothetical protein
MIKIFKLFSVHKSLGCYCFIKFSIANFTNQHI